ncbi:ubiquinol oxidase subunit II [Paenibacillus filicis]|uniref:Quinol oxidase subunit 2 n=1 Tax=Paenibacillus filicis TaxID=669464 RepID=A0ABU9DG15_9BACL
MPNPKKALRTVFPLLIVAMLLLLAGCGEQVIVMDPKGPIGQSQKDLIIISSVLCGIILVPVLLLTAYIVWKYRDKPGNKAAYKPNWSHSTLMETVWWGIPIVIIIILGVVTVKYTHALEPSKPIQSETKAITVQVTSLDWKWLFMYPEQGIATVNYLQIPEGVPVKFELTSDAPMNSFWIPQLGGQMYTMSGMAMTLFLQADHTGKYYGSGANFSGAHFADMNFEVDAVTKDQFQKWVTEVKRSTPVLTKAGYENLATPGKANPQYFSGFPEGLFNQIVNKYAVGGGHSGHGGGTKQAEPAPATTNASDTKR